jgi:hypothetical protein
MIESFTNQFEEKKKRSKKYKMKDVFKCKSNTVIVKSNADINKKKIL